VSDGKIPRTPLGTSAHARKFYVLNPSLIGFPHLVILQENTVDSGSDTGVNYSITINKKERPKKGPEWNHNV